MVILAIESGCFVEMQFGWWFLVPKNVQCSDVNHTFKAICKPFCSCVGTSTVKNWDKKNIMFGNRDFGKKEKKTN